MTVFSLLPTRGRYVQALVFVIGRREPHRRRGPRGHPLRALHRDPGVSQSWAEFLAITSASRSSCSRVTTTDRSGRTSTCTVKLIPGRMRAFWGTSYGFPCRLPLGPFKRYILANEYPVDHYYARYPDASVEIVTAALAILQAIVELRQERSGTHPGRIRRAPPAACHRHAGGVVINPGSIAAAIRSKAAEALGASIGVEAPTRSWS